MTPSLLEIQSHIGVTADGKWGPNTARAIGAALGMSRPVFDREKFLSRHINMAAPAITDSDRQQAAKRLGTSPAHIKAIEDVESGPFGSFDRAGRPIILPEPHIFSRQTNGAYDDSHRGISSRRWNRALYPKSFDGRWAMLAEMAALDEGAALESASWGLGQVMGFHWQAFGHGSVQEFVATMVASEMGQLQAVLDFIKVNNLVDALNACDPSDADSCRSFARRYNGPAYAKNNYHVKFANALARRARA